MGTFTLVLCALAADGAVQAASKGEYDIKAAMLFNLAKFVDWPHGAFSSPSAPLNLCVVGEDPFGGALEILNKRKVKGHPVAIVRYTTVGNALSQSAVSCHVTFVSASLAPEVDAIVKAFADRPSLTVGDTRGFAERGGMINLVMVNNKVRFRINPARANAAGIHISARLLQLATIVKP